MTKRLCVNCCFREADIGSDVCLLCADRVREHNAKYGEGRDVAGTVIVIAGVAVAAALYLFWEFVWK